MVLKHVSREAKGVLWMIAGSFWAAVMVGLVRHLSGALPLFEIVFFCHVFALGVAVTSLWGEEKALWRLHHPLFYMARACLSFVGVVLWFSALKVMPLPAATALSFTLPLFTTLIAMVALKERLHFKSALGLISGFTGVWIILRPDVTGFTSAALSILAAALCWAIALVIVKKLTHKDRPRTVVFYTWLFMAPLAIPFVVWDWHTPSLVDLGWLLALGASTHFTQICISRAFARANITALMPMDFTRLVFVSLLAYVFFGEVVDEMTIAGAIVILAGAMLAHKPYRVRAL